MITNKKVRKTLSKFQSNKNTFDLFLASRIMNKTKFPCKLKSPIYTPKEEDPLFVSFCLWWMMASPSVSTLTHISSNLCRKLGSMIVTLFGIFFHSFSQTLPEETGCQFRGRPVTKQVQIRDKQLGGGCFVFTLSVLLPSSLRWSRRRVKFHLSTEIIIVQSISVHRWRTHSSKQWVAWGQDWEVPDYNCPSPTSFFPIKLKWSIGYSLIAILSIS